jgi:hypothetical protein
VYLIFLVDQLCIVQYNFIRFWYQVFLCFGWPVLQSTIITKLPIFCLGGTQFRGGKKIFLSENLGRRLEIFCKICNVTITKITKQMHNYCIICILVIVGSRLVFVCSYIAIIVCYIPQLWPTSKLDLTLN